MVHASDLVTAESKPEYTTWRRISRERLQGADAVLLEPSSIDHLTGAFDLLLGSVILLAAERPELVILCVRPPEGIRSWLPERLKRNAARVVFVTDWPATPADLMALLAQEQAQRLGASPGQPLDNPEIWLGPWLPKSAARRSVFISYATEDRALADWVACELQTADLQVRRDDISFRAAAAVNSEIQDTIRSCDLVLALISENSANRGYPALEMAWARQFGVEILPVLVGLTPYEGALAGQIGNVLYIRLSTLNDEYDRKVLLRAVLGQNETPHCAPPRAAGERVFVLGLVGDVPTPGPGCHDAAPELAVDLSAAIFGLARSSGLSVELRFLHIAPRAEHVSFSELVYTTLKNRVVPLLPDGRLTLGARRPTDRRDPDIIPWLASCDAVISVGGRIPTLVGKLRREWPFHYLRFLLDLVVSRLVADDVPWTAHEFNRLYRRRPIRRPWLPLAFGDGFSKALNQNLARSWYGPTSRALSAALVRRLQDERPSRPALFQALDQLASRPTNSSADIAEDAADLAADIGNQSTFVESWTHRIRLVVWLLLDAAWHPATLLTIAVLIGTYLAAFTDEARLVGRIEAELGSLFDPEDLENTLKISGLGIVPPNGPALREVTQVVLHGANRGMVKVIRYRIAPEPGFESVTILTLRSASSVGGSEIESGCAYRQTSPLPRWSLVMQDSSAPVHFGRPIEDAGPANRMPTELIGTVEVVPGFEGELTCVTTYLKQESIGVTNAWIIPPRSTAGEAPVFNLYVGVGAGAPRGSVSSFYPLLAKDGKYQPSGLSTQLFVPAILVTERPGSLQDTLDVLPALAELLDAPCIEPGGATCESANRAFAAMLPLLLEELHLPQAASSLALFEPERPLARADDLVYVSVPSRKGEPYKPGWGLDGLWYSSARFVRHVFRR